MRIETKSLFLCLLCLIWLLSCSADDAVPASDLPPAEGLVDMTFLGGPIYTVDREQPWVEAVAIKDGIIVYAGDLDGLEAAYGERLGEVVDLEGTMLMPGFHDVHLHAIEAGLNENLCYFEPFLYLDEYVDEVADCAEFRQRD